MDHLVAEHAIAKAAATSTPSHEHVQPVEQRAMTVTSRRALLAALFSAITGATFGATFAGQPGGKSRAEGAPLTELKPRPSRPVHKPAAPGMDPNHVVPDGAATGGLTLLAAGQAVALARTNSSIADDAAAATASAQEEVRALEAVLASAQEEVKAVAAAAAAAQEEAAALKAKLAVAQEEVKLAALQKKEEAEVHPAKLVAAWEEAKLAAAVAALEHPVRSEGEGEPKAVRLELERVTKQLGRTNAELKFVKSELGRVKAAVLANDEQGAIEPDRPVSGFTRPSSRPSSRPVNGASEQPAVHGLSEDIWRDAIDYYTYTPPKGAVALPVHSAVVRPRQRTTAVRPRQHNAVVRTRHSSLNVEHIEKVPSRQPPGQRLAPGLQALAMRDYYQYIPPSKGVGVKPELVELKCR